MENYEHKEAIISTRKGYLGGSDAQMLSQVSFIGSIPTSAHKRLAICKGLIPSQDNFTTNAMRFGDAVEKAIFDYLCEAKVHNVEVESNPMLVSTKYKRKNVGLICHPDFYCEDESTHTIYVYECKATKSSYKDTKAKYKSQLYVEWLLAKERATVLGNKWKVKLSLVHYNTDGVDTSAPLDFDVNRLTIGGVHFNVKAFDVAKAMDIVDDFLESFDHYYEDEVDSNLLPVEVKQEFDNITNILVEIQERENVIDAFKQRLYDFMCKNDIKSIKNEVWSITRVDASESHSFDYKAYLSDYAAIHPHKAIKLQKKYDKCSKKKGYVSIKLKSDKKGK